MERLDFHNFERMEYSQREAYNTLRTNMRFCGADLKVFMLTSCTRNEGKSTVSFDLARSMAESGKKTLIIDCDLRKSVYVSRYRVTSQSGGFLVGMSHYLSKQKELDEVIYPTNITNMFALLAGSLLSNPTELLATARFAELIEQVKEKFDVVIVDTPPLGAVIDAAVMAPLCDATILVIEDKTISRRFVRDVMKQLKRTGCKIIGVILNKTDPYDTRYTAKFGGKYGGKYGRYGRYGRYGGKYGGRYGRYGRYMRYGRYSRYYKYEGSYYDARTNDRD